MNSFACHLVDHIHRYVELRRSLGYSFETQAATLQAFGRFVKRRAKAGPLTQHLVLTYLLGCPVTPNVRARRYAVLKNFADYFSIFDSRTEALDPQALPRSRAIPPARLLDEGELARLLEAAHGFGDAFRQARAKAGLDSDLHRQLRPHDLRHRFATTRLVTWYREGVDVQARLPLLATYLGHTRYSDTAYYITGTPDLLGWPPGAPSDSKEVRDE
jgi:hypothetical protein